MSEKNKPMQPQLRMKRDDMENLPDMVLPEGYTLRTSQEGDDKHWAIIIGESFNEKKTAEDFVKCMVEHPAYRPDRIFFVCSSLIM